MPSAVDMSGPERLVGHTIGLPTLPLNWRASGVQVEKSPVVTEPAGDAWLDDPTRIDNLPVTRDILIEGDFLAANSFVPAPSSNNLFSAQGKQYAEHYDADFA